MYTTKIWWKMIGLETTFGILVAKKKRSCKKQPSYCEKGKKKIEKKKKTQGDESDYWKNFVILRCALSICSLLFSPLFWTKTIEREFSNTGEENTQNMKCLLT